MAHDPRLVYCQDTAVFTHTACLNKTERMSVKNLTLAYLLASFHIPTQHAVFIALALVLTRRGQDEVSVGVLFHV